MTCDHRMVGCPLRLVLLALMMSACAVVAACGDDEAPADSAPDLGSDTVVEEDGGGRDVTVDGGGEEDVEDDAAPDVVEDEPIEDVVEEVPVDVDEDGIFPEAPTAPCLEGGDGARGTVRFEDGTPLADAIVALLFADQKHLGVTDADGVFYIQAPCGGLAIEVASYDSTTQPDHPSVFNLPLGTFDAGVEEPTLEIPLVTVQGLIVDVLDAPIAGALLTAELEDARVRVFNRDEADADGAVAVAVVPWSNAPYDLTAEGPEDSDKNYRTATLRVIVGDPPPDPSTFTLFEDRCGVSGTIHTSEGRGLEWLYIRVEGDPYPAGPIDYTSFILNEYTDRSAPENVLDQIPLFCGPQRLRIWNAIWLNPNWPCRDWDNDNQMCLNNYPVIFDENVTDPSPEGLTVPVVRISGTVTDELGDVQRDVIVRIEGAYQWGPSQFDVWEAFKEDLTDEDGFYSMVILPQAGVDYRVTTRIRDDDRRPLGAFEGVVEVTEATTYDIELPPAPPRCIMTGTVHSSEGRDFNEVLLRFWGWDFDTDEPLYIDPPWQFFTEEPGIYYRAGFPDEDIPFVPFLCGDHFLRLQSSDWESCNASADEICFDNWDWWPSGDPGCDAADTHCGALHDPRLDGIEIPVVHVSGRVVTSEGNPVPDATVILQQPNPILCGFGVCASNSTGTASDGLYDMVALYGVAGTVIVSVGDDHPMNLDSVTLAVPEGHPGLPSGIDGPSEVNFTMPDGPTRCPFSGIVRTSDGVVLESLDFFHYGAYYGMFGWHFRYFEPGEFFRYPNDSIILDHIPLICGHQTEHDPADWLQDFVINSIKSTFIPSCLDPDRFDQPCLENWAWQEAWSLLEPVTDDIVIPVVRISGTVTLEDGTPIQSAEVEVYSQVCLAEDAEGDCTHSPGAISNYALTRPDGRYQVDVVPSAFSEYTIEITTPLDIDLGSVTFIEVINADTTVDARFSLVE